MIENGQLQGLMEQFYSVVNRTNQLRNVLVELDGCEPLGMAAIHLIETIGSYESINMTEISERLSITKGAVSQMAAKLVAKGLISRAKLPHSEKEIYLFLTDDGRKVFEEHSKLHGKMYAELSQILGGFSEEDLKRITLFLDRIITYINEYTHNVL